MTFYMNSMEHNSTILLMPQHNSEEEIREYCVKPFL